MTRVIGRPLEDIRSALGTPYLPAGAVSAAVHEAAHAVVGMAFGAQISSLWIRESSRRSETVWEGLCTYFNAHLPLEKCHQFAVAGAIGDDFLHASVLALAPPLQGIADDSRKLSETGISFTEAFAKYRTPVRAILQANMDTFDHITAELLVRCGSGPMGVLSEREMLVISLLHPVRMPRKDTSSIEHRMMQHVSPGEVRL